MKGGGHEKVRPDMEIEKNFGARSFNVHEMRIAQLNALNVALGSNKFDLLLPIF
ncbi:MAG: hypothetical protein Q8N88_05180 [Nanoarchaeota archaeon]|jgi:hypothetical protein|nr:hypothetical protein [Nanoarchaeota archaeon]